jgi:hypothetical protein
MTKKNYSTNTTLEQNYIQFNNHFYKQHDRLAMGAPTSAVLAEICIQICRTLDDP